MERIRAFALAEANTALRMESEARQALQAEADTLRCVDDALLYCISAPWLSRQVTSLILRIPGTTQARSSRGREDPRTCDSNDGDCRGTGERTKQDRNADEAGLPGNCCSQSQLFSPRMAQLEGAAMVECNSRVQVMRLTEQVQSLRGALSAKQTELDAALEKASSPSVKVALRSHRTTFPSSPSASPSASASWSAPSRTGSAGPRPSSAITHKSNAVWRHRSSVAVVPHCSL